MAMRVDDDMLDGKAQQEQQQGNSTADDTDSVGFTSESSSLTVTIISPYYKTATETTVTTGDPMTTAASSTSTTTPARNNDRKRRMWLLPLPFLVVVLAICVGYFSWLIVSDAEDQEILREFRSLAVEKVTIVHHVIENLNYATKNTAQTVGNLWVRDYEGGGWPTVWFPSFPGVAESFLGRQGPYYPRPWSRAAGELGLFLAPVVNASEAGVQEFVDFATARYGDDKEPPDSHYDGNNNNNNSNSHNSTWPPPAIWEMKPFEDDDYGDWDHFGHAEEIDPDDTEDIESRRFFVPILQHTEGVKEYRLMNLYGPSSPSNPEDTMYPLRTTRTMDSLFECLRNNPPPTTTTTAGSSKNDNSDPSCRAVGSFIPIPYYLPRFFGSVAIVAPVFNNNWFVQKNTQNYHEHNDIIDKNDNHNKDTPVAFVVGVVSYRRIAEELLTSGEEADYHVSFSTKAGKDDASFRFEQESRNSEQGLSDPSVYEGRDPSMDGFGMGFDVPLADLSEEELAAGSQEHFVSIHPLERYFEKRRTPLRALCAGLVAASGVLLVGAFVVFVCVARRRRSDINRGE